MYLIFIKYLLETNIRMFICWIKSISLRIAAKFSKIKNIIGPGLNQKKWITSKKILNEEHKLNYSEQSQKILEINSIPLTIKFHKLK